MEILELLETIEKIIAESKTVPFSKKRAIDENEILDIIDEIREKLPDEIKQAKWISEERARILQDAQKEREEVLREAEKRIIEMIDEHEITRQAEEKSLKIIEKAKLQSREISDGTREYADSVLAKAEEAVNMIDEGLEEQKNNIKSILYGLKNDRDALRS